jgi:hypothetical protein
MSTDRECRLICTPLPYSVSKINSVPCDQNTLESQYSYRVKINDKLISFDGSMYADDIIGVLRDAWASRPNVSKIGTPDHNIFTMLQATLLVFDAAAISKHGYSNSEDQQYEKYLSKKVINFDKSQYVNNVSDCVSNSINIIENHSKN